jgi:hypothetical protein
MATKLGYVCFYNGKRVEIFADSMFQARELAEKLFKPSKSKKHMISVVLAEIDGKTVVQNISL